jgi:hypothetical protein
LSYQSYQNYDGEIEEIEKLVTLYFFVEGFLASINKVVYFLLETLIMPIFREIGEGRAERCNGSPEMSVITYFRLNLLIECRKDFHFHFITFKSILAGADGLGLALLWTVTLCSTVSYNCPGYE